MGILFTPERKDTLKDQVEKIKQGASTSLKIDQYVTEEELKEVFELETLTSLDISFALISKDKLLDTNTER
jgi:hypothetical protein